MLVPANMCVSNLLVKTSMKANLFLATYFTCILSRKEMKTMNFNMTEHGFDTTTEFGKLHISSDETQGFRPYQLMVASLAACSGGVMRKVLEKMRTPADDIAIEVIEVVRSQDDASKLEKIHFHFQIKGAKITDEKMPRILKLTNKNCSMYQSVIGCIDVVETYELV